MSDAGAVVMSGPLVGYVDGFAAVLASRGYKSAAIGGQLQLMADVSRWLAGEGLAVEDLTAVSVAEFFGARRAGGATRSRSPQAAKPLLGYLAGLGIAPPPEAVGAVDDELLVCYRRHLEADRGLAASTVTYYLKVARGFVAEWEGKHGRASLGALSARDVSVFVTRECRQRNVPSAKALVTALRSWLRYLQAEGVTACPLAAAVPAVAGWRGGWIPRGLAEADVAALIDSIDVTTPVGLRDRAILTLLVRLGLRSAEVAALVLEDVDWRHGEIVIGGKGNRQDRLPLPVDVGDALVAYLQSGRPRVECRAVFVRVNAPIVALSPAGIGMVVRHAGQRAGVVAAAHQLRHSAATQMLRGGASLAEVGQVLRHADPATTAIYAKVDYRSLVALAQPWPGAKP